MVSILSNFSYIGEVQANAPGVALRPYIVFSISYHEISSKLKAYVLNKNGDDLRLGDETEVMKVPGSDINPEVILAPHPALSKQIHNNMVAYRKMVQISFA